MSLNLLRKLNYQINLLKIVRSISNNNLELLILMSLTT